MKTLGRISFISVAALGLTFCSLVPSKKPAPSPSFAFPLQEEARLEYDGEISGGLRADGGKIYFSTKKGIVYAADAVAKKIRWQFAAKASISSAPAVDSDGVIFSDKENNLYCLGFDGKLRWEKKSSEAISGEIARNFEKVFLIMAEINLVALESASGNELWRFKAGGAIRTAPVFWNQQVIFGTADNKVYFLRSPGLLSATFETGTEVAGPLFVDRDRLYFSLKDGTFHCLRLASKKRLWTIKTGGYLMSLPAADDQRILFVTSNNVLFCLNKKSGNLDWWRVIFSRAAFSPAIGDEQIFVASRSPILVALKKNGEPAGTYDAGGALSSAPHCFGENLLINTYNPETAKGTLIFIKGAAPPEDPSKKK